MKRPSRTRWFVATVVLCGIALLFYFLPLFHLVPLRAARKQSTSAAFSAPAFVQKLWTEQFPISENRATNASALLADIRSDPKAARKKHARSAGMGTAYTYFLFGDGRILSVDQRGICLSLDPAASRVDVVIETGNIFGNAVRDGTGLLDVSDFQNSRDFNDVSSEINRRIETEVIPALRAKAAPGATVHFVGCAQIADEAVDLSPLRIVPLSAVVR